MERFIRQKKIKNYQMKRTNYFFHMLIVLGICGFMYCGSGENKSDTQGYDTSTETNQMNSDSASSVHHVDPANAYPQPQMPGSDQDSSRTKDSGKIKDTPNRPGY
jgi:hypothetical protein